MNGPSDVIIKDIYCIACGRALRLCSVAEGCPGCGAEVRESLRQTIMAGGHRHVRRIARALALAGSLNIGLLIGCLLNPATTAVTGWKGPLNVVFMLSFAVFAWWQVVAAVRAAGTRPGQPGGVLRALLIISGACVTAAACAGLAGMTARVMELRAERFYGLLDMMAKVLLPALAIFYWILGNVYEEVCRISGMSALRRRVRRIKYINALGALFLAVSGFLTTSWLGLLDLTNHAGLRMTAAKLALGIGLMLFLTGMLGTTIQQFLMARHLKDLSETLGDRTVLTGRPVE